MFSVLILTLLVFSCVLAAPNTNVIYPISRNVNPGPGISPFVVGGTNTDIQNHPHAVSLRISFGSVGTALCGGSIINIQWVISAAHCFYNGLKLAYESVSGRAGSNYYDQGGNIFNGTKVLLNDYRPLLKLNDIALVKVTPLFPTDLPTIRPIAIPMQGTRPAEGSIAVIAGWGVTSEGGLLPPQLQAANVYIISQTSCKQSYGLSIRDSMFCAGVTGGGIDTCQGDSGGPIVVSNTLVGIVSFGNGCARDGYPGVYTNIGSFCDFIDDAINDI